MKNFFETFTTAVLLVSIVFASVSLLLAQVEILTARDVHRECLTMVEESDEETIEDLYGVEQQLNTSIRAHHKNWTVKVSRLEGSNSRDYYLVTLNYLIEIPIFGTITNGRIDGYAK